MEDKGMRREKIRGEFEVVKMTPAYANKMIKGIEDQLAYLAEKENASTFYVATADEEPVIPEYDFREMSDKMEALSKQIVAIKHALNKSNIEENVSVLNGTYSVDMILVTMAQLNKRKRAIERMRFQLPKVRLSQRAYGSKNFAPEYQYTNYDPKDVEKEYCDIVNKLNELQLELDKHNQKVEFEVYFDKGNIPFKNTNE